MCGVGAETLRGGTVPPAGSAPPWEPSGGLGRKSPRGGGPPGPVPGLEGGPAESAARPLAALTAPAVRTWKILLGGGSRPRRAGSVRTRSGLGRPGAWGGGASVRSGACPAGRCRLRRPRPRVGRATGCQDPSGGRGWAERPRVRPDRQGRRVPALVGRREPGTVSWLSRVPEPRGGVQSGQMLVSAPGSCPSAVGEWAGAGGTGFPVGRTPGLGRAAR